MNYTQEERLDIGRRIYDNEITRYKAAEEYGTATIRQEPTCGLIGPPLPPKNRRRNAYVMAWPNAHRIHACRHSDAREVIKARIAEARLKKAAK